MAKNHLPTIIALFLLTLSSCQSLEQISIDYLQPAELCFPPQIRTVAIVNNTSNTPDNKLTPKSTKNNTNVSIVSQATAYANGDAKIATELLAEEIAEQNYFDKVVICDSALRANDKLARETSLSQEEVRKLTTDLEVDLIIAIEELQLKATKTVRFLHEFDCFQGATDVKVYPTVRIYLPERSKPINTLHPTDSIFWEDFYATATEATTYMTSDKTILKEAAEFAGITSARYIVPTWKTSTRYLYVGGSVQMRDATVYMRENTWDKAYELWHQAFESTKNKKKKMRAALNIAVYYEMKDSLLLAEEWAGKAQKLAAEIDKKDTATNTPRSIINDMPNYYLTSLYLVELKERNSQLPKLEMQMKRFKDDF